MFLRVSSLALVVLLAACSGSSDPQVDAGAPDAGDVPDAGPQCTTADDCPGDVGECLEIACDDGRCGTRPVAAGTPVAEQVAGDCQKATCDGEGGTTSADDDTDVPDDADPCTVDACDEGTPSHARAETGTACGEGLTCNAEGACTGCSGPDECPGSDTECQTRTCTEGVCGLAFTEDGIVLDEQVAGDCATAVCDGAGGTRAVSLPTDLPADDGLECTIEECTESGASHTAVAAGTDCGDARQCDGAGRCVFCLTDAPCNPGPETCHVGACVDGECTLDFLPDGTEVSDQTPGDCSAEVCNGAGGRRLVREDTDLPDDGNTCTTGVCGDEGPEYVLVAEGIPCDEVEEGRCTGAGLCIQCRSAADCGEASACATWQCVQGLCEGTFREAGPIEIPRRVTAAPSPATPRATRSSSQNPTDMPPSEGTCLVGSCSTQGPEQVLAGYGTPCEGGFCTPTGQCIECETGDDCESGRCDTQTNACIPPTCHDGHRNGDEVDVDCGGATCDPCRALLVVGTREHTDGVVLARKRASAPNLWETTFRTGRSVSAPAIAARAGGALALFRHTELGAADDNVLYGLRYEHGPIGWDLSPTAVGPTVTTREAPAVVATPTGFLSVFHGMDFAYYQADFTSGAWSAAAPVGSSGGSGPALAASGSDTTLAFVKGIENNLYVRERTGGAWGPEVQIATQVRDTVAPSVAHPGAGTDTLVVYVGQDGALYSVSKSGTTWAAPAALGDASSSFRPAMVTTTAGNLHLAFRGDDGGLYTKSWNSGFWSATTRLGTHTVTGAPAMTEGLVFVEDVELVYVESTAGAVHHVRFGNGVWGTPMPIGMALADGNVAMGIAR